MDRKLLVIILVIAVLGLVFCCVCGAGLVLIGSNIAAALEETGVPVLPDFSTAEPPPTVELVRPPPTAISAEDGPTPAPFSVSSETVEALASEIVPVNDPVELAMRLQGIESIPLTLDPPPAPLQAGATDSFWVTDLDTNQNFQVEARLEYVTDHLYFWIEDGLEFDPDDVADLSEAFENQIYPTNRAFFGSEWSPGVDGDPHIYVLVAAGLGSTVAGYYSSADEYHPLANEYSNSHEMFYLNYDTIDLRDEFTYGVLAHEFEHMIHWNHDPNEESYIDEGFAEVANFLNGYSQGGFDWLFTLDPDRQLNDWADPSTEDTTPDYGASFLFLAYFLDQLGDEATQALAAHPANGLDSVDAVLTEIEALHPLTGEPYTTDDLFIDWVVATHLNDASVGDGRYAYGNYPDAPTTSADFIDCPYESYSGDVHQYGADLLRISCPGEAVLRFEGSVQTSVLPADPRSGSYAFWSNKANQSDMTLTRAFDFSDHSGPLTLNYSTWYDIEQDYDLVYVEASTDGEDWEILITPSGTEDDPTGNSYGWGYTGQSGFGPEWIQESIDISHLAGEEVMLRFEYVTDAAVTGEGLLLDDVSIPEIGYQEDFEAGDDGWEGEGFVRIQNLLPQTYRLALITLGDEPTVQTFELDGDNTADIPLESDPEADEVILIVTGTTRHTRLKAPYRISIP